MSNSDPFNSALQGLKAELSTQAQRVLEQSIQAVECCFNHEADKVRAVLDQEQAIDRADVEIERHSIPLLSMGQTDEHAIRSILTIVKVNNELERIADCALNVAEASGPNTTSLPEQLRVMANSVLGMLRDTNYSLDNDDAPMARRVLDFDDTVDMFKKEILLSAQRDLANGTTDVESTFTLIAITKSLERIADHCTNICEQVIYLKTGKIVRHDAEGWSDPIEPEA